MYTLKVTNHLGDTIELTHNPAYEVASVEGMEPADATIHTTKYAGGDGSTFNSARVDERTITITMAINAPAEANRIALYRYFKPKHKVRVWIKNGARDVYADGVVQSMQVAYFDKKETVQIAILCPDPFFYDAVTGAQEMSSITPEFEFILDLPPEGKPMSEIDLTTEHNIINTGDVATGAEITIRATGNVTNITVWNTQTLAYMTVNVDMAEGDELVINTRRGNKRVTLIHDGVAENAISKLAPGSTWLEFEPGDNLMQYTAEAGTDRIRLWVTVPSQYEGV